MKKIINYLPAHFLVGLILGIILQFNYTVWHFGFTKLFFVGFFLVITSFLLHKLAKKSLFIVLTFIVFIFVGITSVYIKNPKNYTEYYENFSTKNATATILVTKVLKSGKFNDKYEIEVLQVNNQKTVGRALLNVKKDSFSLQLKVNERFFLKTDFKELPPPMNPHQFNYKKYLSKKQIYQQVFVTKNQLKLLEKTSFSLVGISANVRRHIQQKLKKHHFSTDEFAVINALILGQRQDISKKIIDDYTNAGVIHILAISGLHIGILLWILSRFFQPLEKLKNGKVLKATLLVLLLWSFAFIAGLSASVVRAVTMFSFVSIGEAVKRKQPVEHSLISSMFILLLVKPTFLFNVGFQLSYLAVFGIVWFQPLLYKIWKPKLKVLNFFWNLLTVSVAAQIGILPLSLFYFHQFPGLFLVSNFVIIPVLGGILVGGIFIVITALLNVLPQFLADFYGKIISILNSFVELVSHQEGFLFQQIPMSFLAMLGWYFSILVGYQFLIRRKRKSLVYFLISVILLQTVYLFEKYQQITKKEFLVFHKNKKSVVGNRLGNTLHLFSNLDSLTIHQQKIIENYKIEKGIAIKNSSKIGNVFQFKNETILVVDSLGVYNISIKNPIVLLRQSPKINLHRLILQLHPKTIIADGSNFKSYIYRWKETCIQKKTPFYYTGKNGAYVIN